MKYEISNSVSTSFTSKTSIEVDSKNNSVHPVQKELSSIITSEETRGLTGFVAKTRALFESNTSSQKFSTPQATTNKKKNFQLFSSVQAVKKEVYADNILFKENLNLNNVNETPIKSILRHKDNLDSKIQSNSKKMHFNSDRTASYSDQNVKLESHLNSKNMVIKQPEEKSKELNIPMSVKQAKACFENLANISEKFLTPVSKSTLSKWSNKFNGDFPAGSKISGSVSNGKNSKIEINKNVKDVRNSLTSSSSSTTSESSVFYNSSGSSCENTPISIDKNRDHKTIKVADHVKRLEECKSLGDNETNTESKFPLSFFCPSVSKCTTQTSPFSKSSRFSYLCHKQMDLNPPNYRKLEDIIYEADQKITLSKPIIKENGEKKLKSILRKGSNHQSFTVSEIKIETRSNIRSPSYSSSSSCSPSSSFSSLNIKPLEQKPNKENIDNSSCVVPSKIRERAQSLDISNTQETNLSLNDVSKMNNSFTSTSKTSSKNVGSYIKNVSYSSGNSNCELVKR